MGSHELTKNQKLVLEVMKRSKGPLSAYAILDALKEDGLRAPPQVYRAVEKLQEMGLVHRLESLNAFVACRDDKCGGHSVTAFTICSDCSSVEEVTDTNLTKTLEGISQTMSFDLQSSIIELSGKCKECP